VTPDATAFGAYGQGYINELYRQGFPTTVDGRGNLRVTTTPSYTGRQTQQTAEVGARGVFRTGPLQHSMSLTATGYWSDINSISPAGPTSTSDLYQPRFIPTPGFAGTNRNPPIIQRLALTSLALADTVPAWDERVQLLLGVRARRVEQEPYSAQTGLRTSTFDQGRVTPAGVWS